MRKYYEAYDDRYRQVHGQNLQWFYDNPTPIVLDTITEFGITCNHAILELGCGEGRDAYPLLEKGYCLTATDISPAAIKFAQLKWPQFSNNFRVLDCVAGEICEKFDFIYAVAVVHMLVDDEDRKAFYSFIRNHLNRNGVALICSMGNGILERKTDTGAAFELQNRIHEQSGKEVLIASTTCRMVSFDTLHKELEQNRLKVIKEGITSALPDFTELMYVVVVEEEM